jgi:glycosyltransferase involved in cell wall biosynthesis
MKNKKILVVCQHYWPEQFRINDICEYLKENDCQIDVLCGIPNYPRGKFFEGYSYFKKREEIHNGIKIYRSFEIPRGNNTNLRILINYISFPISSLFHIPRLLTKDYDKIFLYQLSPVMMSIAGIIIGKIKKTETTMYILDLWPENLFSVLKIKNKFLRNIARHVSHWHYKKVDKIIVLSDKMKSHVLNITHISENKITVLPQTCEKLYEIEIQDNKLKSKFNKGFNIVYAGNISPAQDFGTIISAAKQLKDNNITDINWIIVGDGMSRKWVEDKVKKVGLIENFYFEGQKPMADIPKYNAIADILVGCLVKSELLEATIPAKVISYFASGKPMVVAMDGEVQDLVNNKIKCGFAGSASDAKTLYLNIKKMYTLSPGQRSAMGKNGRDYYFKNFERNIILNKLYKFIFNY